MNKFITTVGGISFIILGYAILAEGGFSDQYGVHYFDFSSWRVCSGSVFILIGLLLVWVGIRKKDEYFEGKYFMCPECREPFAERDLPGLACPNCGGQLEELEGFYERHPELKNKEQEAVEKRITSRD